MIYRMRLCAILYAFSAVSLWATDALGSGKRNMDIAFEVLPLFDDRFTASYKFGVHDHIALGFHGSGVLSSGVLGLVKNVHAIGGGGGLGAKFYLSDEIFKTGFYLEPTVEAVFLTVNQGEKQKIGFWTISPNLLAGYGFVLNNGFSLAMGAGLQYYFHLDEALEPESKFNRALPLLDFSVGYAW